MRQVHRIFSLLLIALVFSSAISAQRSGRITGKLIESTNNEPLAFANVYVKGTTIGTITDIEGQYNLDNVPVGEQIIVFSFIGFTEQEIPVNVSSGEVQTLETVTLLSESIMGEEVIITAQMLGQTAAINAQVNSNTIVNVVSRDNIEGVPDVNAAESISRLPGIAVTRNAGEGSKVTIRGVSPRFSSVTINGIRVAATGDGDRSVDLSTVSSDILDGIEVYKAITPDMDADAIGGTVNLVTKIADEGFHGRGQIEGGYHGLINDVGSFKSSVSLGNRFFDNRLGVMGTGTFHRANRNSDVFDVLYYVTSLDAEGNPLPSVRYVYLQNFIETRDRYNASLTTDYKYDNGNIVLNYFYSKTKRDILRRGIDIQPGNSTLEYNLDHKYNDISINTLQLRGEHKVKKLSIDYGFSHSRVNNEVPLQYGSGAQKSGPFASDIPLYVKPQDIPQYTSYDIDNMTGGSSFSHSNSKVSDRNYTGQIDLTMPFYVGKWLNGHIKAGGKIRQKTRVRDVNEFSVDDGVAYYNAFIEEYPDVSRLGREIYLENFIDNDYTGYEFAMGEQYVMPYALDDDIQRDHYDRLSGKEELWWKNPNSEFTEFDALERITAGYLMAEINIGKLLIVPGVRYERDFNEYDGTVGFVRSATRQSVLSDTTGNRTIEHWLPMLHLKYTILKGLNVRLAATKTLTRPDFLNLTPFERISYGGHGPENVVYRGSLDLNLPTSWNYDAFLSYNTKFAFLSGGVFYKKIEDVDINVTYRDLSGTYADNPTYGMRITNPINSERPTTVWGAEVELQTNFRWLPKPFDGIFLNVNYSNIHSETYFPYFPVAYLPPTYMPSIIDTFRINRLPGQAEDILNLTLGYEKKGFSARLSMNYQADKLLESGATEIQDKNSYDYTRWDAVVSQKIGENWMIIANFINITNEAERSYMWTQENPTLEQVYGRSFNLAVRYNF